MLLFPFVRQTVYVIQMAHQGAVKLTSTLPDNLYVNHSGRTMINRSPFLIDILGDNSQRIK